LNPSSEADQRFADQGKEEQMRRPNRQAHEAQLEMMFEEPRPSGANLSSVVFRSESGWREFSTTAISIPAYRRGARQDAKAEC
jgi:hypothetical protein